MRPRVAGKLDFDPTVVAPTLSDSEFPRLWNKIDALPLVFKIDLLHWDRLPEERLREKIRQEGERFYPLEEAV
ncbi:hypothetical protein [Desulfuromonas sp. TF]|uniref:hypothetical protein n=1 Tax=Desulfuromonas sp. TF TaxID=1232410 RepID=UPI000422965B|nr:hypothetical protein [Desulfuromonas sp. TF]